MRQIQDNLVMTIDRWGQEQAEIVVYQSGAQRFTYGDLKNNSDSFANYLEKNLTNKRPVVVFGELEYEMLASFLAVSKVGIAYIPIESNTPLERIQLILQVAKPQAIIAVSDFPVEISKGLPIITHDELSRIFAESVRSFTATPVKGAETYYIIFTSGTTGIPKGVQVSHDNLVSFLNWDLKDFDLTDNLRFLSQAPYSFDLSVMSIYPALASGGSLIPLEKQIIDDFPKLFATLPHLDLDVWVSTPSFMDICLMEKNFDQIHVPSLKIFQFCGEELTKKTASELLKRFPTAKIFNTYGPTEATVAISQILVTEALLAQYDRIPIGFVKADTEVLIMEAGAVTDGVGEIIIKGPSVSKGYLNNPEKTAAAFLEIEGVPAYKTGDAGRLTAEGLLQYEGRMDFQIKLHGFRIELEDIDHHLEKVSYVKHATVVAKYQNHKVQQLVAYVVANPNTFEKEYQLTKAIKAELAQSVMAYMIPQKFIYLAQLPRTNNGKIDRKSLMNEVNQT